MLLASSREAYPAKPPKSQAQRTLARKLQLRARYLRRLCRQRNVNTLMQSKIIHMAKKPASIFFESGL
ncbi:MAG TPA: hypothetical protein DCF33_14510 [Saprospirales bacterium]|nr:hypothetical protein [Saprospirales bacterium]